MTQALDDKTFATALSSAVTQKRLVVVDFWATWCGPCKAVAPVFAQVEAYYAAKNAKVEFYKVDVDAAPDVATRYGIRSIPTFIAFTGGTSTDVKVGGMSEGAFKLWIDDLLSKM